VGVINEPKPLTEPDPEGDAVGIVKVPLALTLTVVEDDCVILIVTAALTLLMLMSIRQKIKYR